MGHGLFVGHHKQCGDVILSSQIMCCFSSHLVKHKLFVTASDTDAQGALSMSDVPQSNVSVNPNSVCLNPTQTITIFLFEHKPQPSLVFV